MYYGEAEKNLGKIFDNCKALGKCIIFIDEIDSLA
jgi:SpoVK/Ycf46/Vps4 family AAA+-type ATPase